MKLDITFESFKEKFQFMAEGETYTTKEISKFLGLKTTKQAYDLCSKFENSGFLYKFGYKTKDPFMTDDISNGNKKSSLIWQRNFIEKNP